MICVAVSIKCWNMTDRRCISIAVLTRDKKMNENDDAERVVFITDNFDRK